MLSLLLLCCLLRLMLSLLLQEQLKLPLLLWGPRRELDGLLLLRLWRVLLLLLRLLLSLVRTLPPLAGLLRLRRRAIAQASTGASGALSPLTEARRCTLRTLRA